MQFPNQYTFTRTCETGLIFSGGHIYPIILLYHLHQVVNSMRGEIAGLLESARAGPIPGTGTAGQAMGFSCTQRTMLPFPQGWRPQALPSFTVSRKGCVCKTSGVKHAEWPCSVIVPVARTEHGGWAWRQVTQGSLL